MSGDDQETNDRFSASLGLPFPLAGDRDGAIRKAFDVNWPLIGVSRRVTYVVGQDRRIALAYRSELGPESHVAQTCAFVSRARTTG